MTTKSHECQPKESDDWGWWAGRSEEYFDVGPHATKEDAIQEALYAHCYDEVQVDGEWKRLVFFAECRGLHYDCDECGTVPKACDECANNLYPEETAGTFSATRNDGSVLLDYDDESTMEKGHE